MKITLLLASCLCFSASLIAQDIVLPPAQKTGGMPLMEALAKRSSLRSFDPSRELREAKLSNLLWATWGINRPDGRRTAPSARNFQECDLYVLLKSGSYLYDAREHKLVRVGGEDLRGISGTQSFVKDAAATVLIVANLAKLQGSDVEGRKQLAYIDAGYISQNMYLYCASENLATVVRAMIDRKALSEKLGLKPDQYIVVGQCVGHPLR